VIRLLLLLTLWLSGCTQPGSDRFFPLGEMTLHRFSGGERNDFEFLGFDTAAVENDFPLVNGSRLERWSRINDPDRLAPPDGRLPADLLRWEWHHDFSGGWDDLLSFYVTQDDDSGTLTLHAVGVGIDGNRSEAVYWLESPKLLIPPLAQWQTEISLQAVELTAYDGRGNRLQQGSLTLTLSPAGLDTAQTPTGRFESLRLQLALDLSLTLPNGNAYWAYWNGAAWLHPALGMVRYSLDFSRLVGSEQRLLQLDRVELISSNMVLPEAAP